MENNNNNNKKSIMSKNSTLKLPSLLISVSIIIILLVLIISNYENQPNEEKDGSKYLRPIITFTMSLFLMYIIYKNLHSNKRLNILNKFSIDKGLIVYFVIVLLLAIVI